MPCIGCLPGGAKRGVRLATAQVHGDAFLARVFDNEDDFERLDFTLREVSSSAAWVRVSNRPNPHA